MHVMICIDEAGGMLFAGRRQSKDRILRQQARILAQGQPLWMNSYTARQFAEDGCDIVKDDAFLENAPADAWCFVENADLMPYLEKITQVAVYRWNRHYPSTTWFPMDHFAGKWQLVSQREFAGSSHDTITEEVYAV